MPGPLNAFSGVGILGETFVMAGIFGSVRRIRTDRIRTDPSKPNRYRFEIVPRHFFQGGKGRVLVVYHMTAVTFVETNELESKANIVAGF